MFSSGARRSSLRPKTPGRPSRFSVASASTPSDLHGRFLDSPALVPNAPEETEQRAADSPSQPRSLSQKPVGLPSQKDNLADGNEQNGRGSRDQEGSLLFQHSAFVQETDERTPQNQSNPSFHKSIELHARASQPKASAKKGAMYLVRTRAEEAAAGKEVVTAGTQGMAAGGQEEEVWKRFRGAGALDEQMLVRREKEELHRKLESVQKELADYRYNLGVLILEHKKCSPQIEELEVALSSTQEELQKESQTFQLALADVRQREEELNASLRTERTVIVDLRRSLEEMHSKLQSEERTSKERLKRAEELHEESTRESQRAEEMFEKASHDLKEARRIEQDVSRGEMELEGKLRVLSEREHAMTSREEKASAGEKALKAAQKELREQEFDLADKRKKWESEAKQEKERLCEEEEEGQKRLAELRARLEEERAEMQRQNELAKAESEREMSLCEEAVSAREKVAMEREAALEESFKKLAENEQALQSRQEELEAREKLLGEEKRGLLSREAELSNQEKVLEDERSRLTEQEQEWKRIESKIDARTAELDAREAALDNKEKAAESTLHSASEQEEALQKQKESLMKEEGRLRGEREEIEQKQKELREEWSKLEKEQAGWTEQQEAVRADKEEMQRQTEAVSQRAASLEEREGRLKALEQELTSKEQSLAEEERKAQEELAKSHAALQSEKAKLQQEKVALALEQASVAKELQDTRTALEQDFQTKVQKRAEELQAQFAQKMAGNEAEKRREVDLGVKNQVEELNQEFEIKLEERVAVERERIEEEIENRVKEKVKQINEEKKIEVEQRVSERVPKEVEKQLKVRVKEAVKKAKEEERAKFEKEKEAAVKRAMHEAEKKDEKEREEERAKFEKEKEAAVKRAMKDAEKKDEKEREEERAKFEEEKEAAVKRAMKDAETKDEKEREEERAKFEREKEAAVKRAMKDAEKKDEREREEERAKFEREKEAAVKRAIKDVEKTAEKEREEERAKFEREKEAAVKRATKDAEKKAEKKQKAAANQEKNGDTTAELENGMLEGNPSERGWFGFRTPKQAAKSPSPVRDLEQVLVEETTLEEVRPNGNLVVSEVAVTLETEAICTEPIPVAAPLTKMRSSPRPTRSQSGKRKQREPSPDAKVSERPTKQRKGSGIVLGGPEKQAQEGGDKDVVVSGVSDKQSPEEGGKLKGPAEALGAAVIAVGQAADALTGPFGFVLDDTDLGFVPGSTSTKAEEKQSVKKSRWSLWPDFLSPRKRGQNEEQSDPLPAEEADLGKQVEEQSAPLEAVPANGEHAPGITNEETLAPQHLIEASPLQTTGVTNEEAIVPPTVIEAAPMEIENVLQVAESRVLQEQPAQTTTRVTRKTSLKSKAKSTPPVRTSSRVSGRLLASDLLAVVEPFAQAKKLEQGPKSPIEKLSEAQDVNTEVTPPGQDLTAVQKASEADLQEDNPGITTPGQALTAEEQAKLERIMARLEADERAIERDQAAIEELVRAESPQKEAQVEGKEMDAQGLKTPAAEEKGSQEEARGGSSSLRKKRALKKSLTKPDETLLTEAAIAKEQELPDEADEAPGGTPGAVDQLDNAPQPSDLESPPQKAALVPKTPKSAFGRAFENLRAAFGGGSRGSASQASEEGSLEGYKSPLGELRGIVSELKDAADREEFGTPEGAQSDAEGGQKEQAIEAPVEEGNELGSGLRALEETGGAVIREVAHRGHEFMDGMEKAAHDLRERAREMGEDLGRAFQSAEETAGDVAVSLAGNIGDALANGESFYTTGSLAEGALKASDFEESSTPKRRTPRSTLARSASARGRKAQAKVGGGKKRDLTDSETEGEEKKGVKRRVEDEQADPIVVEFGNGEEGEQLERKEKRAKIVDAEDVSAGIRRYNLRRSTLVKMHVWEPRSADFGLDGVEGEGINTRAGASSTPRNLQRSAFGGDNPFLEDIAPGNPHSLEDIRTPRSARGRTTRGGGRATAEDEETEQARAGWRWLGFLGF